MRFVPFAPIEPIDEAVIVSKFSALNAFKAKTLMEPVGSSIAGEGVDK